MQDMISKIIKIDEEARKITEEAQSNIEKSGEEVKEYKKKIETEYLDRARKRIEKNRIVEQEVSDKLFEQIKNKHELMLQRLSQQLETNFDYWVGQIKKRVLEE